MITVEQIKDKAKKQYHKYLSAIINGKSIFPLSIPANKVLDKNGGFVNISEQLAPLYQNSKEIKGFGFTLKTQHSNTRHGKIEVIKQVLFETESDYLKFISTEQEAGLFREEYGKIVQHFPQLKNFLEKNPQVIIEHFGKWDHLLLTCTYFQQNPNPNLYARELPIAIPTKFIERNRGIILRLIEHINAEGLKNEAVTFEGKLGLLEKHNLIRIRFLDKETEVLQGFSELGIAETEISKLQPKCENIFIVENDITALTFPRLPQSIVLFGKGYNISSLKNIDWLNNRRLFYWSDLDVHGFEMLSQIRSYYPNTQSILMDAATLEICKSDWQQGEKTKNPEPRHLLPKELMTYRFLRENNIRLEQEKIMMTHIIAEISKAHSGE